MSRITAPLLAFSLFLAAAHPQEPVHNQLKQGADLLQRGEFDKAIAELKKAIALDPQSAAGHMLLGQAYLGLKSVSMVAEAKAELQQALDIDPSLIWARFYLAKVYIDQGRNDKATQELERGLAERPNVPHFLSLLGEVNRKLGDPAAAIRLNQQALAADPAMTPAHYFIALAYMDLKQQDDAIRELEWALKSPYVAPEMYLTLGSLYAGKKRYAEGEDLVKKGIALDPARPEGHLNLAQLCNIRGAADQALSELEVALPEGKALPSSPYYQQLQADVFFERGRAYQFKGMTADAVRAFSAALAFNANEGRTHDRLAALYLKSGDYARASQHLAMAEKLGFKVDDALKQEILNRK